MNDSFLNYFIDFFKYNYAYRWAPLPYYHQLNFETENLKENILAELLEQPSEDRAIYLRRFQARLEKYQSNIQVNRSDLEKWLLINDLTYEELIRFSTDAIKSKHKLIQLLNYSLLEDAGISSDANIEFNSASHEEITNLLSRITEKNRERQKIHNGFSEQEIHAIKYDFFNYWYGYFLNRSISLITDLQNESLKGRRSLITPMDSRNLNIETLVDKYYGSINQFCKKMPLEQVIDHFRVFANKKSKNGKPFLTLEQLDLFIQRAFVENKIIECQKFNFTRGEKQPIINRFHELYQKAVLEGWESNQHCQDKYVKLISENFSNWDYNKLKQNFRDKRNYDWENL